MANRRTRRALGTLVLVLIIVLSVYEFYEFVFQDNGLEFYGRQPWWLAVCIAIGICGAILAQLWQELSKRTRNRPSSGPAAGSSRNNSHGK